MYCTKCGSNIPDDSKFCPECGASCNGGVKNNTTTINISTPDVDLQKHKSYVFTALKHPINTMREGIVGLSSRAILIYGIIITLLIPLIKTLSIKMFSYNLFKSIMNLVANVSGEDYDSINSILMKQQFKAMLDMVFPTGSIYFLDLLSYVFFYGILVLLTYLIYKFLIKEDIALKNLGNIFFVFSIINFILVIFEAVALIIGVMPWAIISIFASIISVILIYSGFNSVIESKNKLIYLFSVTYVIALGIVIWVSFNNIISVVTKIIYNVNALGL